MFAFKVAMLLVSWKGIVMVVGGGGVGVGVGVMRVMCREACPRPQTFP